MTLLHETDKRPVAEPDHLSAPLGSLCSPQMFSPSPHCNSSSALKQSKSLAWIKAGAEFIWGVAGCFVMQTTELQKQQIQLLGMLMLLNSAFMPRKVYCSGFGKTSLKKKKSKLLIFKFSVSANGNAFSWSKQTKWMKEAVLSGDDILDRSVLNWLPPPLLLLTHTTRPPVSGSTPDWNIFEKTPHKYIQNRKNCSLNSKKRLFAFSLFFYLYFATNLRCFLHA